MPLKIKSFAGDGTSQAGQSFEYVVRHPETNELLEDVVITCRVMTKAELRDIRKAFTTSVPDPRTQRMIEKVDELGAEDEMIRRMITNWRGFVGADDVPLVCNDATKVEIDDRVKQQLVTAVMSTEVTGRSPATFRQTA